MSTILTLNQRHAFGLKADRVTFKMNTAQFRRWINEFHDELVEGLADQGVRYEDLSPALVPSRKRHEMALLFNIDQMNESWYSRAVLRRLLPLLDKRSTRSVLHGDIPWHPEATRELAMYSGFVPGALRDWGEQFIYCVYITNLSAAQLEAIRAAFAEAPGYLGHVLGTYHSAFRTEVADILPVEFLQHRATVITDHGNDEPLVSTSNDLGMPFEHFGFNSVSAISALFTPLLSYKIQSERAPLHRDDLLISLNAISDEPMELSNFEVLIPDGKFGYLHNDESGLLTLAGLDEYSREKLAAVIRAEIENDYIYRLQTNVDGTAQFTVMLQFPRLNDHPVRRAVGLKYFPDTKQLSFVTLT